ncbi:hypothetical protein [Sphingomonas sp.]|uniref:hypothetical protein n=1 Tax=Sphingomonas sp. TaxID=28214 RepID=UPI00286C6D3D|nr:hypothetical protein [Sphingomonas sp.]
MKWPWAFGASVLLIASAPGKASDALKPTAKWVVNFDNAQCVASRKYGTADKPIFLVLKATPLGDLMRLAIMREGSGGEAEELDATVKFDEQPAFRTSILV